MQISGVRDKEATPGTALCLLCVSLLVVRNLLASVTTIHSDIPSNEWEVILQGLRYWEAMRHIPLNQLFAWMGKSIHLFLHTLSLFWTAPYTQCLEGPLQVTETYPRLEFLI